MSYSTTFKSLSGAAAIALAAGVANADTQNEMSITDMHDAQMINPLLSNTIIPPEVRPFIGDLNVSVSQDVDFENGVLNTTNTTISITDLECDFIQPMFEEFDAQDLAQNEFWGIERSAEEQMVVDGIRTLFQDRVFAFSETFTAQDMIDMAGEDAMFLPTDLPASSSISIELECSDYVAPEPSFTPVEPN